jgi:hypothetical protein
MTLASTIFIGQFYQFVYEGLDNSSLANPVGNWGSCILSGDCHCQDSAKVNHSTFFYQKTVSLAFALFSYTFLEALQLRLGMPGLFGQST